MTEKSPEEIKNEVALYFGKEKKDRNKKFMGKVRSTILTLAPGVKQITQLRTDLIEYLDGNEVLRLVEFFYGINYYDNPNMLVALGPEYAEQIIKHVMDDSEDDKLKYYINLILNIHSSELTINERKEITRILNSLSTGDIELAKEFYVYENYELVGYESQSNQLNKISETDDGFTLKSINALLSNGLIVDPNKGKVANIQYYKVTKLLVNLITMICDVSTLLPERYSEREKKHVDIILESHGIISNVNSDSFISILNDNSITAAVVDRNKMDNHEYFAKYYLGWVNTSGPGNYDERIVFNIYDGYRDFKENKTKVNGNNGIYKIKRDADFDKNVRKYSMELINSIIHIINLYRSMSKKD